MSMPSDDHMSKAADASARRIEVFTGAGRRRAWTAAEKAAIVAESYAGAVSVCEVARRHGLTPTQLFTWRRAERERAVLGSPRQEMFAPAIVDALPRELVDGQPEQRGSIDAEAPFISVEIDGASLWICRGADVAMVTAIVKALKGSK